jgi:hypothetical protein
MDCWPLTATICGVLGLRYISTGDVLIRQIGNRASLRLVVQGTGGKCLSLPFPLDSASLGVYMVENGAAFADDGV